MHREARSNADVIARLEPGVVVSVKACNGDWCEAEAEYQRLDRARNLGRVSRRSLQVASASESTRSRTADGQPPVTIE
jgi:hypothetical protein